MLPFKTILYRPTEDDLEGNPFKKDKKNLSKSINQQNGIIIIV